jgi:hypothetical protein
LFVEAAPGSTAGRPVFLDYATDLGSLGVPAGTRIVKTVGAAALSGRAEPSSTMGPPLDRPLLVKPDLLAYDALALGLKPDQTASGTSLSTSLAAGTAATLLSGGMPPRVLEEWIAAHPGQLLRAPPGVPPALKGRRVDGAP